MTPTNGPDVHERRALGAALVAVAPWIDDPEAGPRAVDAGQCDRCGRLPRLLPTCGPVAWPALCRDCATEVGTDGWCDGHAQEASALLAWAARLPPWWADAVVLWWVSTGEVAWSPELVASPELPARVRAELPRGSA